MHQWRATHLVSLQNVSPLLLIVQILHLPSSHPDILSKPFMTLIASCIPLLLKPNKDPTICSSYHPLSLINTGIKTICEIGNSHSYLNSQGPNWFHQSLTLLK